MNESINNINWFPGHMAKTRRMIKENLKYTDIVIELLDARIPSSSRNPEIASIVGDKPMLTLLNKSSLADPVVTRGWIDQIKMDGGYALDVDCIRGDNINKISVCVKTILKEKIEKFESKGMSGRQLKAMVVGIPNVGKSSLVNKLSKSKKAKVEDRPGVTLNKQWIATSLGIDLLDMPGVLWPKFEDKTTGENLALTGAIKDSILDTESLGAILCGRLADVAKDLFLARYKMTENDIDGLTDFEVLEKVGKKRGYLVSGGEIDTERTALMLLDEFRSSKIGRITLERPNG
ncbi:MAG: ribosome biogenesis GTPase YlqF [Clostridia bacterium]|nr:ribosome biogenesis GTPase YlqF [Clostridia bacterium]